MNRTLALIAAKILLGTGLAVGFAAAPHGVAHADDTALYEDSPGWSCVDDGNRTCGPGNPQGVPAGRYDERGVLVDPWPVDEYAYERGAFVGGYNERAMKTAVNQKLGGRKTITAAYRYVPWSGPTAGWHQMMSKTDMSQKTHNGFVR